MNRILCFFAGALAAGPGSAAHAEEVPLSAFTPAATLITFDGLAGGQTIGTGEIITTQYAALGATFNNPDRLTRANANLAAFFATNSSPNIAFVDQGGGGTNPPLPRPQEVLFASPQLRVGCWFGTSGNATLTIEAYNGETLLESITRSGQPLGSFGLEGFVGVQRAEGITMVRLSSASLSPGVGPFNFSFDDVRFEAGALPPPCYPNCDDSTQAPVLNVADFGCFLTRYAAGEPYANCDESTQPPVLNVADFGCFLTRYAAGCP